MATKKISLTNFKAGKKYCSFRSSEDAIIFYVKHVDENLMTVYMCVITTWHHKNKSYSGFKIMPDYKVRAIGRPESWFFGEETHLCKGSEDYKKFFDLLFRY